jgi:hypothetical protein
MICEKRLNIDTAKVREKNTFSFSETIKKISEPFLKTKKAACIRAAFSASN